MILKEIAIERLIPEPDCALRQLDTDNGLAPLAASLDQQGLLQPIAVGELPDGSLRVIAGYRRLGAAQLLQWQTITCTVRYVCDESEIVALAASENLHRRSPSASHNSRTMQTLVSQLGSASAVAAELGFSRSKVVRFLRLARSRAVPVSTTVCEPGEPCSQVGSDSRGTVEHDRSELVELHVAVVRQTVTRTDGSAGADGTLRSAERVGCYECKGLATCEFVPEELREPIRMMIHSFQEARSVS